jgi:hypothetical protein
MKKKSNQLKIIVLKLFQTKIHVKLIRIFLKFQNLIKLGKENYFISKSIDQEIEIIILK